MKVTVKMLQGSECVIDISPAESVLELKEKIKSSLGIDVNRQKLLLTGKALADENSISFYPGIKEGTKLNLVVKKSVQNLDGDVLNILRKEMTQILVRYYSESEAEAIANEIIKDLKFKVNHLSYDDLERLATVLIQDDESRA